MRQFTSQLLISLAALTASIHIVHAQEVLPYQNPSLPFEKRVDDLMSRMTFEEKADQCQVTITANPRLGIKACRFGLEAMHGLPSGGTMFPDSMALAATWNPALIHNVASAIGDEARAHANPGDGTNGLILWCPNLNLARDPRSGRNMETYGEDPFLAGRMGAAYVSGIQGNDPKYVKTIATPKHFTVYSVENGRASSNAIVSQRALHEYYLKPFETAFVQGGALATMSAFNAINSIPCTGNPWLLTTVLREDWKFQGAVVTDSGAVGNMTTAHRFTRSDEEAVATAINAGVDVILGNVGSAGGPRGGFGNSAITAVFQRAQQQGLFKEGAVDRAASRSLFVRFKLGLFDPPELNPFASINASVVGSPAHLALALQSAREAITLLQNNEAPKGHGFDRLLPMDPRRVRSIAVLGPNALVNLHGSYAPNTSTGRGGVGGVGGPGGRGGARGPVPVDALKTMFGERMVINTTSAPFDTAGATDAASRSDIVLFFGGFDTRQDHAGNDRTTMDLPYEQLALLEQIIKANPLVVVILNGGSVIALESLKSKVPAIMMMWYDGEKGGEALADVLFGKVSPAGRLPVTFHGSLDGIPPLDDYELTTGRTYMYFKRPVAFPFGHGLSYTTFGYENLKVVPPTETDKPITASIDITNTGERDGDEVAQLYARIIDPKINRPLKQLVAFERIALKKGEKRTVTFTVPQRELAYWDTETKKFVVDPGAYEFMTGASSEDIRQRATIELK